MYKKVCIENELATKMWGGLHCHHLTHSHTHSHAHPLTHSPLPLPSTHSLSHSTLGFFSFGLKASFGACTQSNMRNTHTRPRNLPSSLAFKLSRPPSLTYPPPPPPPPPKHTFSRASKRRRVSLKIESQEKEAQTE